MLNRILLGTALSVLCIGTVSPPAFAHGGQFLGPGGGVPPGLRDPFDPTPPPPAPGPYKTPTSGGGPAPSPGTTGGGPTGAGPITGPGIGTGTTAKRRGPQTITFENWVFWYHNNKRGLENLKDAIYSFISSDTYIGHLGNPRADSRTGATHAIRAAVETTIIPAMLWAMDPKNAGHPDVESSAFIALGKMARDPAQIGMIMKGLDRRLKRDRIVQESAALALGLLRRADAEDQFTAAELDRVRTFLFEVFENADYETRTRGFAALSLGLLGDQPTGSAESGATAPNAARDTTTRLFELLRSDYRNQDLVVGLLMAVGMQRPSAIADAQREVLRDCVTKGRLYGEAASDLVRAYAALCLGRIGTARDIPVLQRALLQRGGGSVIQRSAAIGLGRLARHVTGDDRVALAEGLLKALGRVRDASTKNFGTISVAYVLNEDIRAGRTDVFANTKAGAYLLQTADEGRRTQRAFGALATALVCRQIGVEAANEACGEFRQEAMDVLRRGLGSIVAKRERAAFATALGIARDEHSVRALTELIEDRKEDQEVRGYAALAVGLIGHASKPTVRAIRDALRQNHSEEMRLQCATALGLLRDRGAVDLMLEELSRARSQSVKGQLVLALANIGDERAVGPLVGLLKSEREQDLTRALACAGLGVVGDMELIPSMARIGKDINYRASTDLINEVLTIL